MIKKFYIIISLLIIGCSSQIDYTKTDGVINIDYLFNSPNTSWFEENYSKYTPDFQTLSNDFSNLKSFEIEVFMNVNCHDSEREVPRLIKILDQLKFSKNNLKIVLLNSDKKSKDGLEINKKITNTPTIIFKKDSIEINRIVEFPVENLEKDIFKIINNQDYKNVYFVE